MRNLFITSLIFVVFIGCKKLEKLTQFEMNYSETVTVPATTLLNLPFNLDDREIESNSTSTFESNNTNKDLIETIYLQDLVIEHKSPSNGDLSFLQSVEVYIEAEGLPEIRVAYKENITNSVGNSLALETSKEDLKEYVKKDNINLRVHTVTDESLSQEQVLEIKTTFFVDAKILGF